MKLIHLLFIAILFVGCKNSDENPNTPPQNTNDEKVTIGTQIWMLKNLNVTSYRNGDPIQQVTDPAQWSQLTTGAWCYYNNDPATGVLYGKLYNWYAVNDPRGLAPTGWHVPTDNEWKTLEMNLGMSQTDADAIGLRGSDEGGKIKEVGTTHWLSPNTGATNSTGFTALPGGYRSSSGLFYHVGTNGYWWSTTEYTATSTWSRYLYYTSAHAYRYSDDNKTGFSVRCVMD